MKIAICVAGLIRGNYKRHLRVAKSKFFGADVFYSTWSGYKDEQSEKLGCMYFDEPEIHYQPWTECVRKSKHPKYHAYTKMYRDNPNYEPKFLNATKQLISHAYQLKHQVPKEYDLIVRTRYDTHISDRLDFSKYIKHAYTGKSAVGFAIRGTRHGDVNSFKKIDHIYPRVGDTHYSTDWGWYLNDNLIIHYRDRFDPDKVLAMHENKELLPAEFGWYQVLSEPIDDHLSVYGGAALERYVP